jgi:hypothetical protein
MMDLTPKQIEAMKAIGMETNPEYYRERLVHAIELLLQLVIAHISRNSEEMMGERLDGYPRKSSGGLPDGAQSTQQDVGTIPIGIQAEFAT